MDDQWLIVALFVIALLAVVGVLATLAVMRSLLREQAIEREERLLVGPVLLVACGCPRCAGPQCDRSWGRA